MQDGTHNRRRGTMPRPLTSGHAGSGPSRDVPIFCPVRHGLGALECAGGRVPGVRREQRKRGALPRDALPPLTSQTRRAGWDLAAVVRGRQVERKEERRATKLRSGTPDHLGGGRRQGQSPLAYACADHGRLVQGGVR